MKYIDAEKLIERLEEMKRAEYENCGRVNSKTGALQEVQELIDTLQQEQPDNMIQWTGNNLKEVIDFTGKSPRFGEWFKSWEEYENYVHTHNDILKLFCEDGSHYEVPTGAWIVKTPDGYNVPSVSRFVREQPDEQPDYGYLSTEYVHGKKSRWNVGDVLAYYICTSNEEGEYLLGKIVNVEFDEEDGWIYTFEDDGASDEQSLVEEGIYKKN